MSYDINHENRQQVFNKPENFERKTAESYLQTNVNHNVPGGEQIKGSVAVLYDNRGEKQSYAGRTADSEMIQMLNNDPTLKKIFEKSEIASIQLDKTAREAEIEIETKEKINENHLKVSKELEEYKADISRKAKLETLKVLIMEDRQFVIFYELSSKSYIKGTGIYYRDSGRLIHIGNSNKEILYVRLQLENGKEIEMYLNKEKMEGSYINKKFGKDMAGMWLPYKIKTYLYGLIIYEAMQQSWEKYIPQKHGWYEYNGKIKFAYPEDPVWEEVEKYAL